MSEYRIYFRRRVTDSIVIEADSESEAYDQVLDGLEPNGDDYFEGDWEYDEMLRLAE